VTPEFVSTDVLVYVRRRSWTPTFVRWSEVEVW